MQLISTILAALLVGLFTIHMSTGIRQVHNDMWQNEVMTQVSGVGQDVLEHVLRRSFDENTDESKINPLSYPVITSAAQLTSDANFGGCTSLDLVTPTCDDIDDFDGLSVTKTSNGFPFTVDIQVQYVNPDDPTQVSSSRTVAKEVQVTVTTPMLTIGGNPIEVKMSRVVTYNRHMTAP